MEAQCEYLDAFLRNLLATGDEANLGVGSAFSINDQAVRFGGQPNSHVERRKYRGVLLAGSPPCPSGTTKGQVPELLEVVVPRTLSEQQEQRPRTMAESFVRRALEFRRMSEIGFLGQCAGEVSRAAFCFPGMSTDAVAQSVFELYRRHGDAVHAALTRGVKSYADDLVSGTLPASCILRMAIPEHRQYLDQTPLVDPVETEPTSDLAKKREHKTFDTVGEIRLSLDDKAQRVELEGVSPVTGPANYSLIVKLVAQYRQDREAGRAPENFKYTSARKLAETFSIREPTLRKRVNRFRKQAAERFEDRNGLPLMRRVCLACPISTAD